MPKIKTIYVPGAVVDNKRFNGAITIVDLKAATIDPKIGEIADAAEKESAPAEFKKLQKNIQRPFKGGKKRNHFQYKEYLHQVVIAGAAGQAPPIFLYARKELRTHNFNRFGKKTSILEIPPDTVLLALDGETQLSAWHSLTDIPEGFTVPIFIMHSCSRREAQQAFHDLNRFGVNLGLPLAIQRDHRDPANNLLKEIEKENEFFHQRISFSSRAYSQAPGAERPPVVTAPAFRMFVRCAVEGEIALSHVHQPLLPNPKYNEAATDFAHHAANVLAKLVKPWKRDIEESIFSVSTMWAALGCVLHTALKGVDAKDRKATFAGILRMLSDVQWEKGRHWDGICLSYAPDNGGPCTCTAMSVKHAGRATLKALLNPETAEYRKVRGL